MPWAPRRWFTCDRKAFLERVGQEGGKFPPDVEWLVTAMAKEWAGSPGEAAGPKDHWIILTSLGLSIPFVRHLSFIFFTSMILMCRGVIQVCNFVSPIQKFVPIRKLLNTNRILLFKQQWCSHQEM